MWQNIEAAPQDSIFGLTEAFKNDPSPQKVNLGVGVYKDDAGMTPILHCVKLAEKRLLEMEKTKSYLPISGDVLYAAEVQKLLFSTGDEVIANDRAATVHTPGGTGALRVGGELLKKFNPNATVWLSKPTWANHRGIFEATDFKLAGYEYYDPETKTINIDAFMANLGNIPAGDIVLLHGCCHNPTGVDLNATQWTEVARLSKEKGWIPFIDFAYQGFAQDVEEDRCCITAFATLGVDFLVASSFSKTFGLYNERTGALTVVSPTSEESAVAFSHLKATIRVIYSNPPAHGGLVVSTILNNRDLHAQWLEELAGMRERIKAMRVAMVEGLSARGVEEDFSFITAQRGMFSFSGLSNETVNWLRTNRNIYMVTGGRINLAGLTKTNVDYVCDSIAKALEDVPL